MVDSTKTNGSKNITIRDIAIALNLSKTTVSRAMSGKGRISDLTKKRVQDYVKKHNYKPNVIAKGLAQSKTFNIGIILPVDANLTEIPFFQSCLMGICEEAATIDYDVVVTTVKEDDISLLKRLIANQKVDGVILTRALVNDVPANYLKEVSIPFVVIGQSEDDEIIQIDSNHVAACKTHNPPITAVNINVKELGITAVRKLNEIMLGEEIEPRTWVDYEISLRESTYDNIHINKVI